MGHEPEGWAASQTFKGQVGRSLRYHILAGVQRWTRTRRRRKLFPSSEWLGSRAGPLENLRLYIGLATLPPRIIYKSDISNQ
jgi:hypothetical protein